MSAKRIAEAIISKSETQEQMVAELVKVYQVNQDNGRPGAKNQDKVIKAIEELAISAGRPAGGTPSLGDSIIAGQAQKIARYGSRAYSLSEKQLAVIVRENWGWVK